ncbi:hypothetical protein A3A64_01120 [Candidatus Gottesmanbacteria bacterium RIFCSPLOWO2_01_FULL_48_11]|uniref:Uncharacterized protein n=1 Tax=Candidatus Gottesmanbacteria bacterium RIFCSPLOWO2_01_FULL_48_11 TaxID=1798395 RepID=A0A1F6ASP8_9BACT|nr:MAG: hypothetical protein A3A64_01120 [Candidatus Gottesmanbacteria bacterium RIFCSPLOWO2_01_FULL_48_11]
MIFFRDFKATISKKFVALALLSGVLGILAPIVAPQYGTLLSILFFILSFFFALFANRFEKFFEGHFKDQIRLRDSFHAVLRDKDGKIKTERNSRE